MHICIHNMLGQRYYIGISNFICIDSLKSYIADKENMDIESFDLVLPHNISYIKNGDSIYMKSNNAYTSNLQLTLDAIPITIASLFESVICDDYDNFIMLLDTGIDCNEIYNKHTIYTYACVHNKTKFVEHLLTLDIRLDHKCIYGDMLSCAVLARNTNMVEMLLDSGIEFYVKDALENAILSSSTSIVKSFLCRMYMEAW